MLAVWSVAVLSPVQGFSHDIPNERVDRSIQVEVGPNRLRIGYEVGLSELTLAQDLRNLLGTLPGSDRQALFERYGRETGPLNARGLLVTVDGRDQELRFQDFTLAVEEHPRYLFHFEANLPPRGRLVVQDTNYVASEGTSRLALRASAGVEVRGYDGPGDVDQVPIRPVWRLNDAEERRTKRVEVDFGPPTLALTSPPPRAPAPSRPTTSTPSVAAQSPDSRKRDGLSRLLDRPAGLTLLGLWLTALGLGAAHAVQPGHGKSIVAAAMVGERGEWGRGLLLAAITTLAHFGVVVLLAAAIWVTRSSRYAEIHSGLAGVAGFLIAAVGLWRLGRHLGGYGEHAGASEAVAIGGRGLIGLGLAGGLVPCWEAVVLVVLAELAGRLALGIFLLTGFSLGMGAVLVAVALLAGRLRELVPGRLRGADWERGLGIAGGLALSAIGLYLLVS